MKAIKEFLWYKEGDMILEADKEHFDKWVKEGLISGEAPKINELDLNKDGKVDSKDKSIAGKVLASKPKKRKKK